MRPLVMFASLFFPSCSSIDANETSDAGQQPRIHNEYRFGQPLLTVEVHKAMQVWHMIWAHKCLIPTALRKWSSG